MDKGAPAPIEQARPRGIARDVGQIKRHGGATAAELAEFLKQLRGRRPQEVLGLVAQSGLLRATALATAGTLALLAALTVIPYFYEKSFPERAKPNAAEGADAAAAALADEPAGETAASDSLDAGSTATGSATPRETELQPELSSETMERLGIEETVPTDPNVNPLEDRFDDLLDGAE